MSNWILTWRRPFVVLAHAGLWTAAYAGAFLLRFDFAIPAAFQAPMYALWVIPLVVIRTVSFGWLGLFHGMWKYTGQRDLENLVTATVVSTGVFALAVLALGVRPYPRSVFLMEPLLSLAMVGGLRLAVRAVAQTARRIEGVGEPRRLLIVGAGDAGETLLREINRSMPTVTAVGFLDDNPHKRGMTVHGVRVLGGLDDAERILAEQRVGEVVIAIPTASGKEMRRIVERVSHGVTVRTLPGLDHLIDGRVTVKQIREVDIEDLLGRDPVELDTAQISDMVRNEVVLVTGAGGSIGSELCRQVCRYQPRTLILVERAENALYEIHRELTRRFPDVAILPRIADITDARRMGGIFETTGPGLVFHAAAHKHVPMMELNAGEAVKNNIGGTRIVADCAQRYEVRRFVMISTDKAVHPTSVMGGTKRVAELLVQGFAKRSRATTFVTVRFGNVLGSNGSVIPLFKEQIAAGGPVTVTHPDMVRYFMTIPEASQLVLQAGAMGQSGEIYILDMGEPVKIVQLAEDLIRLSGLRPHRDVEIAFSGMRPGEKLFEEIALDGENAQKTRHPKIFVGNPPEGRAAAEPAEVQAVADRLLALANSDAAMDDQDSSAICAVLAEIVPTFRTKTPEPAAGQVIPLKKGG